MFAQHRQIANHGTSLIRRAAHVCVFVHTVANESMDVDMNGTSSNTALQNTLNSEFRKTWNPRYILKYD